VLRLVNAACRCAILALPTTRAGLPHHGRIVALRILMGSGFGRGGGWRDDAVRDAINDD